MDNPPRPWDLVTIIHVWDEDGTKRTYGPFWGWIPHKSDPLIAGRRVELEAVMQTDIPDDVIATDRTYALDLAKARAYQDWLDAERQRLAPTVRRRRRHEVVRAIPKALGYALFAMFTLFCLAWAISMWVIAIVPIGIWFTVALALAANSRQRRR